MSIILLLSMLILAAGAAGVWRARRQGATARRVSIVVLVFALAAVVVGWYVIHV